MGGKSCPQQQYLLRQLFTIEEAREKLILERCTGKGNKQITLKNSLDASRAIVNLMPDFEVWEHLCYA